MNEGHRVAHAVAVQLRPIAELLQASTRPAVEGAE